MTRGDLLKYLLPALIAILVTVAGGAVTIKADIAVLSDHVNRVELEARGHVIREVLDLQMQTIRLELRLVEQKIDAHAMTMNAHNGVTKKN